MLNKCVAMQACKRHQLKICTLAILLFFLASSLTLFSGWESTWETWYYWFFSRILAETGRFIIPDRSPLYTVYLLPFRLLKYPYSVEAEYICTMVLTLYAVRSLLRDTVGEYLSVFVALLWVPYLQASEPSTQCLALAASCAAVLLRTKSRTQWNLACSYALFGIAYLFRTTYIVLLLIFALWDLYRAWKSSGFRRNIFVHRANWPCFLVVALIIIFRLFQSPSQWNNAWTASTKWFPVQGKSLVEAAMIQYINWDYIQKTYGTMKGHDFYFTNKEIFGNAANLGAAFYANPRAFVNHVQNNIQKLIPGALSPTLFRFNLKLDHSLLLFILISMAALLLVKESSELVIFVLGSVALMLVTCLARPEPRYSVPLVPLFSLAAIWFARFSASFFGQYKRAAYFIFSILFLALCSSGYMWVHSCRAFARELRSGHFHVLENPNYSFKAATAKIDQLLSRHKCNSLMVLEHTFIGAYTPIALNRLHDAWEIPPFGELGDGNYEALDTGKIDCLLLSGVFEHGTGEATNLDLRYDHYIKPYVNSLLASGGKSEAVPQIDGEFVVAPSAM